MNPYDEGTPEWLIYETEGEDDSEPIQFPRVHGLFGGKCYGTSDPNWVLDWQPVDYKCLGDSFQELLPMFTDP